MGETIYKCNSGHIKAFPLDLKERPTYEDYTQPGVDQISGLIDFQWATASPASRTTDSTTGSIIVQGPDQSSSLSTIMFNTLPYTILNVQITQPQHSKWLIADPGQTNKQDLIILLQTNSPSKKELIYLIFVIPLLNTGSEAKDPEYLRNTNYPGGNLGWGQGVKSCFPTNTFPTTSTKLFAHYVTCFDGYTSHARTQNIDVFVSTVAIPVSSVTMTRITAGRNPGVIELPVTISNLYYTIPAGGNEGTARTTAANRAGAYSDTGGITLVSPKLDFPNSITTTVFSTQMSNAGEIAIRRTRTDGTNAYQCVELDPDTVDANNNIHIDLETGKIASTTLDDILAEREIFKQLVNPNEEINPRVKQYRNIAAFTLAGVIILGTFFGLRYFVFLTDTTGGRSFWETLLSFIIGLTLFIAAVFGFLLKDEKLKEIGGWMALASTIAAFLFFLWFFVIFPSPATTECGKTASALAKGTTASALAKGTTATATNASVKASIAAATAQEGWPAFFNSWKGTSIQVGITGAIFGLLGFIIGNIV